MTMTHAASHAYYWSYNVTHLVQTVQPLLDICCRRHNFIFIWCIIKPLPEPTSWLLHLQKPHILRSLMKRILKWLATVPKVESTIINTQLPFYHHQSMQTSNTSAGLFCAGLKGLSHQDWADPLQAASLSINGSNLINTCHFGVWKESQTGNLGAWKHDGSKCEREKHANHNSIFIETIMPLLFYCYNTVLKCLVMFSE